MYELLWDIGWFGSAVWLGWASNTFWQALKRRIRFRVNIGEHISEDPETLRRMIASLKINNEVLRNANKRKDQEIVRLRKTVESFRKVNSPQ